MIKFLKNLFKKKNVEVKSEPIVSESIQYIPETEIEKHLVSEGFIFKDSLLLKRIDDCEITYNSHTELIIISKSGGNVKFNTKGNLLNVKRFLNKYII